MSVPRTFPPRYRSTRDPFQGPAAFGVTHCESGGGGVTAGVAGWRQVLEDGPLPRPGREPRGRGQEEVEGATAS